jgi:putative hydrolase of the HAD superfamily
MPITRLVFDLDDTLYAQDCGLWNAIGQRINLFMIERLGMPAAEVPARRAAYFQTFGTTLNGLIKDYQVDPAEYLDFAHDLRLEDFIHPDPDLDAMLSALPAGKSIFTNADAKHAARVLDRLGIARHFDSILDIWGMKFVNKPQDAAYQVLLGQLGAQAQECAFIEDSLVNLRPARAVGMKTIWIHPSEMSDEVDSVVRKVYEVEAVVSGWSNG